MLELPTYRVPALRTALLHTFDRATVFVRQAGTIILLISIALWALATYPKSDTPASATALAEQATVLEAEQDLEGARSLRVQADHEASRYALSQSFAGRLGKFIEPVVRPLGFDWQIGIGVISSFAAREVIVSTLAVVYGLGRRASTANRTACTRRCEARAIRTGVPSSRSRRA